MDTINSIIFLFTFYESLKGVRKPSWCVKKRNKSKKGWKKKKSVLYFIIFFRTLINVEPAVNAR